MHWPAYETLLNSSSEPWEITWGSTLRNLFSRPIERWGWRKIITPRGRIFPSSYPEPMNTAHLLWSDRGFLKWISKCCNAFRIVDDSRLQETGRSLTCLVDGQVSYTRVRVHKPEEINDSSGTNTETDMRWRRLRWIFFHLKCLHWCFPETGAGNWHQSDFQGSSNFLVCISVY